MGGKMELKVELLKDNILDFISNNLDKFEIDADEISNSNAIIILEEIQQVIKNETYSDFETVEQIVCIFEKHHIDFGTRHDF